MGTKALFYGVCLLSLVALTACGGSSGGSTTTVAVTSPPTPPPPPPTSETSSDRPINESSAAPLAAIDPTSGALFYGLYSNEGQTTQEHLLPDFSHAGYEGGGVALPTYESISNSIILDPIAGDNHSRIQQALDDVAALPQDARGIRGAILLRAGLYEVSAELRFPASGVILRGEGQGASGTILRATTNDAEAEFIIAEGQGGGDNPTPASNEARTNITSSYVAVGSTKIELESVTGYSVGDLIAVRRTPNDVWLGPSGVDTAQYGWTVESYDVSAQRKITDISDNVITVDIPLVDTIEDQFGGGEVYRVDVSRRLSQIGLENLRLETVEFSDVTRRDRAVLAVKFDEVENSWIRDVTVRYFSRAFNLVDGTHFVTAQDVAHIDPNFEVVGGNHYAFDFGSGGMNFFQRCYADNSRHAFTSGSRPVGPNVFLDCLAVNGQNDSGPHQRWAVGTLFDNTSDDLIRVQNRTDAGSGHGWAGAQQLLWNGEYNEIVLQAPPGAMNWSVGSIGQIIQGSRVPDAPDGIIESTSIPVLPRSLYLQQLEDRLGEEAVDNIAVTNQKSGTIYDALRNWRGDGKLEF